MVKTRGGSIKHAHCPWLLLAKSHLVRRLFLLRAAKRTRSCRRPRERARRGTDRLQRYREQCQQNWPKFHDKSRFMEKELMFEIQKGNSSVLMSWAWRGGFGGKDFKVEIPVNWQV